MNNKPAVHTKQGGTLALSGTGMAQLVEAVLARGLPCRFKATGASMAPLIRDGDIVTVSPSQDARPRFADIAAVMLPQSGKLVLHRIVAEQDDHVVTKADNSVSADGSVPRSSVLGRVSAIERDGRRRRLGLGPERYLIALLARSRCVASCTKPLRRIWALRRRGRNEGPQ